MPANESGFLRRSKKTILIVGESTTDRAFLLHVKGLYISRESNVNVAVEKGQGGSPGCIIRETIRFCQNRAYDERYVLIDSDIPIETNDRSDAQEHGIRILLSTPCIEGLLLAILDHSNFRQSGATSANCKREFKAYMRDDQKTNKHSYAIRFSRDVLDGHRTTVPELDAILKAMQVDTVG